MEWIAIKAAAEYVTGTFREVVKTSETKREQSKKAVSELQTAVLQTRLYVSSLERGEQPNREVEGRLVSLWGTAANAFHGIDGTLAAKLQLKAEYWTDPQSWSGDEVREAGIALDCVAEFTRQLLYESK